MSAAVLTPPGGPAAAPAAIPPPAPALPPLPPAPAGSPVGIASADLWRLSTDDYEKLFAVGILSDHDPVELLDGLVVRKPMKNPPHVLSGGLTRDELAAVLPAGWFLQTQDTVKLRAGGDDASASMPEPDVCVLRGARRDYADRHAGATDIPLVVEVSDSSIGRDQGWKKSIYARNGIPCYWIVNLTDRTLEVYSLPAAGEYTRAVTLTAADRAEVVLDGVTVGTVAVAELLP